MKKFYIPLVLLFSIIACSCKVLDSTSPKKLYKNDSYYYIGLRALDENNEKEAKRLFRQSARIGSKYVSRSCYEQLTHLGNVKERLQACEILLKKYDDDDARLIAAKHFYSNDEYTRLINLTADLNPKDCNNQLMAIRLKAMHDKQDSRFYKETFDWFISRGVSYSHNDVYKVFKDDSVPADFEEKRRIIEFRMDIFRRSYKTAYEKFTSEPDIFPHEAQIISDFGKACLYGNENFYRDAMKFDSMVPGIKGQSGEFYANFYAGRLYEKAGNYFSLASSRFKAAMESSLTDNNYDNALWYLLNLNLKRSTERAIAMVKEYCHYWHNPSYFDDFFNTLTPLMLSEAKWNNFFDLYKSIDGFASDEVVAKLAYIYGRLVQEKLALPVMGDTHSSEDEAAFTRALTSGSDTYYKVMAVSQLGLSGEHAEEILCLGKTETSGNYDPEAEHFLLGYAVFGLPKKVFPEWNRLYVGTDRKISLEAGKKLASYLKNCGDDKEEFYPQSLRIAARVIAKSDVPVMKQDMELLFPRDFSNFVSQACAKYSVPEEVMYALIRSESFFDSQVSSSAGAVGLTQLMTSTAGDISKKLKIKEYNLKNAQDNINMGTYYISELSGRLENDWLNAFFSYNAGITRVRRWIKSSKVEFNNRSYLPEDLFLETIPYDETREYGRKLVGATAMYGWLYYNKDINTIVKEIVK